VTVAASTFFKEAPDIFGVHPSTFNAVYRTQRQDELIPKCRGKNIAELDSSHAALLLLGCVADVPAHNAGKAARLYYDRRSAEGKRAGDEIVSMLDSFNPSLHNDPNLARLSYHSYVVVDLESPRVTVVRECNDGTTLESVFGMKEPKSYETRVSTSKRISGKVLFELAALLNKNEWDAREKRVA
jgi:hypothetical protein